MNDNVNVNVSVNVFTTNIMLVSTTAHNILIILELIKERRSEIKDNISNDMYDYIIITSTKKSFQCSDESSG